MCYAAIGMYLPKIFMTVTKVVFSSSVLTT
jgi:hypothetical protein